MFVGRRVHESKVTITSKDNPPIHPKLASYMLADHMRTLKRDPKIIVMSKRKSTHNLAEAEGNVFGRCAWEGVSRMLPH